MIAAVAVIAGPRPVRGGDVMRFTELPDEIRARVLTGAPRTSPEITDSPFGVHTTLLLERSRGDARFQEEIVGAIVEGGFKWVVDYVNSYWIEEVSLAEIPGVVGPLLPPMVEYAKQLEENGVNLYVRIDYPRWSSSTRITGPITEEQRARMEAFVTPIVQALAPYCNHWQFYNEPNMGNADPFAKPEDYVDWLKEFRKIVKAVQPEAAVSGPAPSMLQCMIDDPYPWLPRAFEAGLAGQLDQLSYHPYRQPYMVANIPEHASEFYPWEHWGSYYRQIADLREMIRSHNDGQDLPLAVTEDGMPNEVTPGGEQEITQIIGAKYELRRSLLDNWLGVDPRAVFILYRDIKSPIYEKEPSFNILTPDMDRKPAYYAMQNLNAVLDNSCQRNEAIPVDLVLEEEPDEGTSRVIRTAADAEGMQPGGMEGLYVQTYTKDHGDFEELLVFFWSAEPSDDKHVRRKGTMILGDPGWIAPLEIDLMAMPSRTLAKRQADKPGLLNPDHPDRLQPKAPQASIADGVITLPVQVRDYPMLVKWVRLTDDGADGE
jgi:hypothetical protein